jgi:ubiquinone/menaquinone biosynthesis C-methylase UbiE
MNSTSYIPALRFNFLTRWYDAVVGLTMPEKKFKQALIAQAKVQPPMNVLDFGCGTLTLSLHLRMQNSNVAITAVDVDDRVLKIAHTKNENANAGIAVIKYDGIKLPFPDNSFDRVLSSLVFHHLTREQKTNSLREINRVLKPDGELHIADWGQAANKIMRSLFYLVQLLDGFETTADNVDGKLPAIICFGGFKNITVEQKINTVYGTLELFKVTK